jgi:tetratricopeptide (TPR) repeat protein
MKFFFLAFFFSSHCLLSMTAQEKLYERAQQLFEKKEYKKSQYFLLNLIKWYKAENNQEAYFLLAETYRKTGNYQKAIKHYDQYLTTYKRNKERSSYGKGQSLFHLKKFQKAESIFISLSAEKEDFYLQSLIYLGEISIRNGHQKKAQTYFNNAIVYLKQNKRYNKAPGLYRSLQALTNPGAHKQKIKKLKDYKFKSIQRVGFNSGLPENTITDISIDKNIVWIGTYNAGLYRLNSEKNTVERIKFPTDFIRNISSIDNQLFIATYDGIFTTDKQKIRAIQIKKGTKRFSLAQNILIDNRNIYVSTLLHGVIKLTNKKKIQILDKSSFLKTRKIFSLAASESHIAFGTVDNGCILKNKKTGDVIYINQRSGLKDNNIKALAFQREHLWIATHYGGIYKFNLKSKSLDFLEWKIPFPTSIIVDNDFLIIGSNGGGVFIADPYSSELINISKKSGLLSNDIQLIKKEKNHLWIGYLDKGIEVIQLD